MRGFLFKLSAVVCVGSLPNTAILLGSAVSGGDRLGFKERQGSDRMQNRNVIVVKSHSPGATTMLPVRRGPRVMDSPPDSAKSACAQERVWNKRGVRLNVEDVMEAWHTVGQARSTASASAAIPVTIRGSPHKI